MGRDCAKIAIQSLFILYRNRIKMINSWYIGINFRKNDWKSWNYEMIIFILKYKRWRHCNNVIVMTSSRRREISDDALARISLRFVFTLWNKHSKIYFDFAMRKNPIEYYTKIRIFFKCWKRFMAGNRDVVTIERKSQHTTPEESLEFLQSWILAEFWSKKNFFSENAESSVFSPRLVGILKVARSDIFSCIFLKKKTILICIIFSKNDYFDKNYPRWCLMVSWNLNDLIMAFDLDELYISGVVQLWPLELRLSTQMLKMGFAKFNFLMSHRFIVIGVRIGFRFDLRYNDSNDVIRTNTSI